MAPFADTMSFIDSNPDQLTLLMNSGQYLSKVIGRTQLRCDIKQPRIRVTTLEIVDNPLTFRRRHCRRDDLDRNAQCLRYCNLVVLEPSALMSSPSFFRDLPSRRVEER